MYIYLYIYVDVCMYFFPQLYICMYVYIYRYVLHVRTLSCTNSHTLAHTRIIMRTRTCAHAHTHTHTYTRTHAHTHTRSHAHPCAHMLTRTHAHMRTRTHIHAHTNARTHSTEAAHDAAAAATTTTTTTTTAAAAAAAACRNGYDFKLVRITTCTTHTGVHYLFALPPSSLVSSVLLPFPPLFQVFTLSISFICTIFSLVACCSFNLHIMTCTSRDPNEFMIISYGVATISRLLKIIGLFCRV